MLIVAGALIVTLSLTLEPTLGLFERLTKNGPYKRLEWQTNGVLQLQRLIYEGRWIGDWIDTDRAVPLTEAIVTLPPLDIGDLKHPILARHCDDIGGSSASSLKKDGKNGRYRLLSLGVPGTRLFWVGHLEGSTKNRY